MNKITIEELAQKVAGFMETSGKRQISFCINETSDKIFKIIKFSFGEIVSLSLEENGKELYVSCPEEMMRLAERTKYKPRINMGAAARIEIQIATWLRPEINALYSEIDMPSSTTTLFLKEESEDYKEKIDTDVPKNTDVVETKNVSITDVSDVELGFFFLFSVLLSKYEEENVITFCKEFDADVEIPQLFKETYKAWEYSDGSMEFEDFCDKYLIYKDSKFGNPSCPFCQSQVSLADAFQRSGGEWSILCPDCGKYSNYHIPNLLIPVNTPVVLKNGYDGVIIGNNFDEINEMKNFVYKVVPKLYAECENRDVYAASAKIGEIVKIATVKEEQ